MGAGALLLMMAELGGCAITDAPSVALSDHAIRLRDVVTPGCFDHSANSSDQTLTIATLPRGVREIVLSHAAIASLVRRRLPRLADLPIGDARQPVTLRAPIETQAAPSAACFSAARALEAGEAISSADLTSAPCAAAPEADLIYDRVQRVVRARRPVANGAYIGRLLAPAADFPDAGDELVVRVESGAVHIERAVVAAQAAPDSQALFVRAEDGSVFSVPAAIAQSPTEAAR